MLKAPVELLDVSVGDPGPTGQAMVLYPNPAGEVVHLAPAGAGSRYRWARVLDAQGNPVREARAAGNESLRDLSLAGLPAGLYAVRVFDGKRIVTHHLVKE
ncbi:MAG: T9SS type A sorting domain-containing protein [Hymenobacter sp.]